jgi:hydroxymethylpyrimidine pyrophosphatase-like HAD family hydrolase
MKKLIIAIDFDGTIVEHEFPAIGKLRDNAFEVLKRLKKQGHKLILWTCRDSYHLENAIEFCAEHGVTFDAVNDNLHAVHFPTSRKIYYDLLVDDRNLKWNNDSWLDIEKEIQKVLK